MVDYKQMYECHPVFWWFILILRIGFVLMCVYFLWDIRKRNK